MPSFSDPFPSAPVLKILYLGDSGAGKTGSIVALAAAGYNVRILDLDVGVELIYDYVHNPASPYLLPSPNLWTAEQAKSTASRISYVTISDTMKILGGKPSPTGDSWVKIGNQLNKWKDGELDLGNVGEWGINDVLVIDGLTKLAKAAWYNQLAMNGRLGTKAEQSDYFLAQDQTERFVDMITGPYVKCNMILICHIDYIEKDDGTTRGFPLTIGKALSPKIGTKFNHTLLARSQGQGAGIKRKILTNTVGSIDLKNTAPLRVKPEYDLGTGLAEYFRDVRGGTKA